MLVESGVTTDGKFGRILTASSALRGAAADAFTHLSHQILGRDIRKVSDLDMKEVSAVHSLLRTVSRVYSTHAPRGVDRSPSGQPLPPINGDFTVICITDCVAGEDAETEVRMILAEDPARRNLGRNDEIFRLGLEPLNDRSLRGAVTSAILTQKINQAALPDYFGQLVLLGNVAARNPNNPDAKSCPFVWAHIEGDIFYLGTLNEGGTELQGIKRYVKEMWRTNLGLEQIGTSGGRNSLAVFRSQFLLETLSRLVDGDERVLIEKLDPETMILPIQGIQVDSRDRFGNLKLTIPFSDLCRKYDIQYGSSVELSVGGITRLARVAKSHGDGGKDEILLVPGSSPRDLDDSGEPKRGADIVINNGSAALAFVGADFDRVKVGLQQLGLESLGLALVNTQLWAGRRFELRAA